MREIVQELTAALRGGRALAYCRLVETRGSTPQKAGAMMLVYADGSQAGTLGGGCVEAEVKRRALAVLGKGTAEIACFQLDSDYGWDDGLICGGRMQVLIQPLVEAHPGSYFACLQQQLESGAGVTEAIVFDAEASSLPAPQAFLFDENDFPIADLASAGSGAGVPGSSAEARGKCLVPEQVQNNLRPLSRRPRCYVEQGVAYLPTYPRCRLVIVGGGHVGQAVADLAADLDFDVWVVDDREDIISEQRFPHAARRIAGSVDEVLPSLEITPDTFCLIVTRGHNHDEEALFHLAERGARYVGLIGSRRKIRMIFEDLLEAGISPQAIEQVHAPVGIDIGSQTVPEIAISICSELVAFRNCDGTVPGRPQRVAVPGA